MKVKLTSSIAGDRFSVPAGKVMECSEAQGQRLVDHDLAVKVGDERESDFTMPSDPPPRVRPAPVAAERETATQPSQNPEKSPEFCTGKTKNGNDCRRKPLPGTDRCAEHPRE